MTDANLITKCKKENTNKNRTYGSILATSALASLYQIITYPLLWPITGRHLGLEPNLDPYYPHSIGVGLTGMVGLASAYFLEKNQWEHSVIILHHDQLERQSVKNSLEKEMISNDLIMVAHKIIQPTYDELEKYYHSNGNNEKKTGKALYSFMQSISFNIAGTAWNQTDIHSLGKHYQNKLFEQQIQNGFDIYIVEGPNANKKIERLVGKNNITKTAGMLNERFPSGSLECSLNEEKAFIPLFQAGNTKIAIKTWFPELTY